MRIFSLCSLQIGEKKLPNNIYMYNQTLGLMQCYLVTSYISKSLCGNWKFKVTRPTKMHVFSPHKDF